MTRPHASGQDEEMDGAEAELEGEGFAQKIFDLVAPVGHVSAWSNGIEFDWVVQVRTLPSEASLPFQIRMNDDYLIVESPQLGWWTFDWGSADDAWRVIEQIVTRGAIVYRTFAWTGASELRDLDDQLVSGPHKNGGLRLRRRRAVYFPYEREASKP
jgi:hypothetical protein